MEENATFTHDDELDCCEFSRAIGDLIYQWEDRLDDEKIIMVLSKLVGQLVVQPHHHDNIKKYLDIMQKSMHFGAQQILQSLQESD